MTFNANNTEWRDGSYSLFLGEAPALHDAINVRYPTLKMLAERQVSNRWVFDEFNHDQSRIDLLGCPKSIYETMLMNLAYQWEADSVASRAIAPLFAPFVTDSSLWEVLMENTNMEITHAKTYSEIVRHCVADPQVVFKMVMENQRTLQRAETVGRAFDNLAQIGANHIIDPRIDSIDKKRDAILLALCALYFLERIQFQSSFSATFAIVEQGYVQSIGTAVQKIMVDELFVHSETDIAILRELLKLPEWQASWARVKSRVQKMFDEVVETEVQWGPYLFSEGRSIVGLNAGLLHDYVLWNASPVAIELGLTLDYPFPTSNPLPWMDNWTDIDKRQNAMQEADGNNYALNTVKDDLGDEVLDF